MSHLNPRWGTPRKSLHKFFDECVEWKKTKFDDLSGDDLLDYLATLFRNQHACFLYDKIDIEDFINAMGIAKIDDQSLEYIMKCILSPMEATINHYFDIELQRRKHLEHPKVPKVHVYDSSSNLPDNFIKDIVTKQERLSKGGKL